MIADRHVPSPHWDDRRGGIAVIVLHEEPADGPEAAVAWLCNPASRRSLHYLVAADGTIVQLVVEGRRAWHCGPAHWRDHADTDGADLDGCSIGIGVVRTGAEDTPYPDAQVDALCRLVDDVKTRHGITRGNIVGQGDVAPARVRTPGAWFPWHRLARLRLALPRPTRGLSDPQWSEAGFLLALERFGYDVADPMAAIMAFQRRFRPEMVDGEVDAECRMILLALLLPRPTGDD